MTAMSATTPQYAQFMQDVSHDAGNAQVVQTTVNGMAKYIAGMGKKATQFVKDVGGNLCKNAAASVIAGIAVAGMTALILPAAPVGASLLAGSFAARAAQGVVEAVVDTAIDNVIKVQPKAPAPSR